jgi:hypothetical protein
MISLASPKTHHRTVFTTILGLVIVILVFGLWYFRRDRIQTQHEVKHAFSVVSKRVHSAFVLTKTDICTPERMEREEYLAPISHRHCLGKF